MTAPALIWAMTENRVIGSAGGLPWNLPDDMRWFIRHTRGKPVIMGRKTFESMDGPLPGRRNLVLSQNSAYAAPGIETFAHLEDAYEALEGADVEPMVIGGSYIYALALRMRGKFAPGRLYRTCIHAEVDGDVRFPDVCMDEWQSVFCERHEADEQHAYAFTFEIFERAVVDQEIGSHA